MKHRNLWIGVGLGSVLTALLDPNAGGRRRAWLRDKGTWALRKTREGTRATASDAGNRARGMMAAMSQSRSDEAVSDSRLEARVRSAIGRACSHARALTVRAVGGDVSLSGPILTREREGVMAAASVVPGVERVHDGLTPYDSAEGVPSLQGEGRQPTWRQWLRPRSWAPTARAAAIAGLSTVAVIAYARRRR